MPLKCTAPAVQKRYVGGFASDTPLAHTWMKRENEWMSGRADEQANNQTSERANICAHVACIKCVWIIIHYYIECKRKAESIHAWMDIYLCVINVISLSFGALVANKMRWLWRSDATTTWRVVRLAFTRVFSCDSKPLTQLPQLMPRRVGVAACLSDE